MTGPTPYQPLDGHIICLLRDVPEGWEHRFGPEDVWEPGRERRPYIAPVLVEARPVRQPDPNGLSIDTWFLPGDNGHSELWVTTVGEMSDRTDLDQWEYADNDPQSVGWTRFFHLDWNRFGTEVPDDFPVIVRRVL